MALDIVVTHGAGLDVHKRGIVATVLTPTVTETLSFGTCKSEPLALADWLHLRGPPRSYGSDGGVLEAGGELVRSLSDPWGRTEFDFFTGDAHAPIWGTHRNEKGARLAYDGDDLRPRSGTL